jgi:hypothetical protein
MLLLVLSMIFVGVHGGNCDATFLTLEEEAQWNQMSDEEWLQAFRHKWESWRVANGGVEGEAASILNDPNFVLYRDVNSWRYGNPTKMYRQVRQLYLRQRKNVHKPGSLAFITDMFVKNLELEYSNILDVNEFVTVDPATFEYHAGGQPALSLQEFIDAGTYNAIIGPGQVLFDYQQGWLKSHEAFWKSFQTGFAWEVESALGGPPVIAFSWRHWGNFTGDYVAKCPGGHVITNKGDGQIVNLVGSSIATLNDALRITKLEVFSDPSHFLKELSGEPGRQFLQKLHQS